MSVKRKRFEWQAIHAELDRRLARFAAAIDDDEGGVREMLIKRSLALAAVPRSESAERDLARLLVFRVGAERFAVALEVVCEVVALSRTASIPGAGPGVVGIVNWRGEFVIVFDPAPILGRQSGDRARRRAVVVLRGGETQFGLAVDSVDDVVRIDLAALQPATELRLTQVELFRGSTADGALVVADEALRSRLVSELQAA